MTPQTIAAVMGGILILVGIGITLFGILNPEKGTGPVLPSFELVKLPSFEFRIRTSQTGIVLVAIGALLIILSMLTSGIGSN